MKDTISSVKDAELKAKETIEDAKKEAEAIVKNSLAEREDDVEKYKEKLTKEEDALSSALNDRLQDFFEQLKQEHKKNAESIKLKASKNKEAALSFIKKALRDSN